MHANAHEIGRMEPTWVQDGPNRSRLLLDSGDYLLVTEILARLLNHEREQHEFAQELSADLARIRRERLYGTRRGEDGCCCQ
ncbi:unnamed protein product [Amoebophrya sp. A25]|nr:unnamed protein product [Amoebophrya sp. A25]|eukprot:GSA25T00023967001.1